MFDKSQQCFPNRIQNNEAADRRGGEEGRKRKKKEKTEREREKENRFLLDDNEKEEMHVDDGSSSGTGRRG